MRPFLYQQPCLRKLRSVRRAGTPRALVVMATGLGKTVVAAFDVQAFLREHPGTKILYISHQDDINQQARETFEEVLGIEDYSFGTFHGANRRLPDVDVLFATFQLLALHRERFGPDVFDYIVVDESHHSHAETYRPTIEYFRPMFMLAITATPNRSDEQEITELFGQPVFDMPLEVALARKLLCHVDYRLMTDEITNLKVLDTPVGKLSIKELNRTLFIPRRDEEIVRLIQERVTQAKIANPRMVVFCTSIEHAKRMAKLLPGAEPIYASLGRTERRARLARFRSGATPIITTVDLFNEGVDVPAANVIVFLRSTQSKTVFYQQLGRGLRKLEGKESVLVLDFVANCDRLEMVADLWTRVRAIEHGGAGEGVQPEIPASGVLEVDFGSLEFTEIAKRILDVVGQVREGYDDEFILEQLRDFAKEIGHTPSQKEVRAAPNMPGSTTYVLRFGSFNEALRRAGLQVNRAIGTDNEVILQKLRVLARTLGRTPSVDDVTADPGSPSPSTLAKRFGSFNKALTAAGLKPNRQPGAHSKERAIEQLKQLASELGRAPTRDEFAQAAQLNDYMSVYTLVNFFGSFQQGLIEAGLAKASCTREQAVEELRQLATTLGRTPRQEECPHPWEFKALFESYTSALQVAGLTVNRNRRSASELTREAGISQLQELTRRLGHIPVQAEYDEAARAGMCMSRGKLRQLFGSYNNALDTAGLKD